MSDLSTTYDDLPYHDQAFVAAHPDRLAVVGRLHGVDASDPAECRVLELGCGLGGHLIPMAAVLPRSRLVGIDLSARQIEQGTAVVERLGLENVRLHQQDLLDYEGDAESFDYIVCHGVYSWVPPAVQDRILAICARCLSPQGLAMISYNTFPGWRANGAVRDLLRYGARGADRPREQLSQALDFLSLVARNLFDSESPYARVVQQAAERLPLEDPTYVFHEYLEESNAPVRFDDFVARATEAGLRFVGDADMRDPSARLSDEARSTLTAVADDVVRCEQFLDFLRDRRFRRDVLCRSDAAVERWPQPQALTGMFLVSWNEPVSARPRPEAGVTEQFRNAAGRVLSTADPLLKRALLLLHGARPRALAYPEIVARLQSQGEPVDEESLRRSLLACAGSAMVGLHAHRPPIAERASNRPRASVVARWQASEGKLVVDPRHRSLRLDPLTAAVLSLLDGTRDRAALRESVGLGLRAGRIEIAERPDRGRRVSRKELAPLVDGVLDALATLGLLLDDDSAAC